MSERQMTFEDVVDMEQVAGDPEYNRWLSEGRSMGLRSWDEFVSLRKHPAKPIEDVVPGL